MRIHVIQAPKKTLTAFGPLLKRKAQNPHATFIKLFLNATHGIRVKKPEEKQLSSMNAEMKQLSRYIKPSHEMFLKAPIMTAETIRVQEALGLFRDYDSLFQRFMEDRFKEVALISGLEMKDENTIQEKWPMRLREGTTQEEFDFLIASGHTGSERYVEWRVCKIVGR